MIVFPAIDLIDGKCVRLVQGAFDVVTEYHADPLDIAKKYEDAGLSHLHLVDLDGARAKKIIQYRVLEKIASKTKLKIDYGGGLQSSQDIDIVFECGGHQANIGSLAVKDPDLFETFLHHYSADKIIFAADVQGKYLAVNAWAERSKIELTDRVNRFVDRGLRYLTSTDISKDGMLAGSNQNLYRELYTHFPNLRVTASGGVSSEEDLQELKAIGCYGAIIGKALYENKISLETLYQIQNQD
jgi:phosphoribosylformimino-5-aminoimidazole carboxamide ribotide isomerase